MNKKAKKLAKLLGQISDFATEGQFECITDAVTQEVEIMCDNYGYQLEDVLEAMEEK